MGFAYILCLSQGSEYVQCICTVYDCMCSQGHPSAADLEGGMCAIPIHVHVGGYECVLLVHVYVHVGV